MYHYDLFYDGNKDTCRNLTENGNQIRVWHKEARKLAFVKVTGRNLASSIPNGLRVRLQPPGGCSGQCTDTWCIPQQIQTDNGLDICEYLCKKTHIAQTTHLYYTKSIEICEISFL